MKCEWSGCKNEAAWWTRQTVGKRQVLHCCDEHKPDASKRPESLRHLPFFSEVKPIAEATRCMSCNQSRPLVEATGLCHTCTDIIEQMTRKFRR